MNLNEIYKAVGVTDDKTAEEFMEGKANILMYPLLIELLKAKTRVEETD